MPGAAHTPGMIGVTRAMLVQSLLDAHSASLSVHLHTHKPFGLQVTQTLAVVDSGDSCQMYAGRAIVAKCHMRF